MILRLNTSQLQAIQAHAAHSYPEECCGLLLGTLTPVEKTLVEVRPVENAWTPEVEADSADHSSLSKRRRYWIAPEIMLKEMRYARLHDLEIIGVYHSHPDHPAVPSECDRQQAWPQYSYLIVSVQQRNPVDYRSWSLDEANQFQPEAILISDSAIPTRPC